MGGRGGGKRGPGPPNAIIYKSGGQPPNVGAIKGILTVKMK